MNSSKNEATPRKKIPVPLAKLEQHLEEQLNFLRKSAAAFDAGDTSEFRRLAVPLGLLLHHNPKRNSHSLLEQLSLGHISFASFTIPLNPRNALAEFSLAQIRVSEKGASLEPLLDKGPFQPRWIDLQSWMNEPVLRGDRRQVFSRSEIFRYVADQDAGRHVDPQLDEKYHRLVNDNAIGLISVGPNGETPIEHVEKVYLRHIAWEALLSIETAWDKVIGNRPCPCGTGRKYRYCHGKKPKR